MSEGMTFDQAAAAEEHLRFVLNTTEGVLGVLGTTVRTAALSGHTQPETKRALDKVAKALERAHAAVRTERDRGSRSLHKRALKTVKV